MWLPPNELRISRAAVEIEMTIEPKLRAKIGLISGPRSGVGLHARVIRIGLLPMVGSREQRARRMLSCA